MRVGFIGLGSQGGPMARRIVEAGYPTTLWARRTATTDSYGDTAAKVADSPAALAAESDLVCLCVVGDADVREVLEREDGVLAGFAGSAAGRDTPPVIAIHSTVHPDTCRELAEIAANQGVSLIDAPVSGGAPAVAAGRLLVMAGGGEDTLARCLPVFETYANPVVHLGGVGAGQTTKLLNNLLFTAHMSTAVSTLELGARLGVSPERLGEVIGNGSGNSFALGRILAGGGTLDQIATHAGDLLRKDVRLISELAAAADITPGVVLDTADATLGLMGRPR
ncbi:NAD(P)-dependent oxidoreductase [Nocardia jinanensis]|uniref:6-phosphogluconate dehydrogenase n=1 Tax=Nocardia jinanensis TaxID=382504 RepID=A0A917RQH1_9NOCA|nr:NAD(P)-dependent oxidoreductase [Nocardia jinanensis]GGL19273.1 6-phosphogluconate dehydrogenase [Nocardia jinanensis]